MNRHTFLLIISKKSINYSIILIFILFIVIYMPKRTILNAISIGARPLDKKIVVIDPGHGGIDGGTNTGDILEKNINLTVALGLKDMLIKKGATVVLTRETDESLDDQIVGNGSRHREDLNARVKITNDSNADILISIHVNHIKNANKIGPIVFYQTNSETGKCLAEYIQESLNDISTYKKKDIKVNHNATPADYFILANTSATAVIVEMGFLSNKIDRVLLLDSDHQHEIVEQITKGIIAYIIKD